MENKEMEFDVEYKYNIDDKKPVTEWSFNPVPPITVASVAGHVGEERSDLTIVLSNRTVLQFQCAYYIGPPDGRKRDYATLIINDSQVCNVKDQYMENLENYGNNVMAVLKTYEAEVLKLINR